MIKSFRHRGLQEVFSTGKSRHVSSDLVKRVRHRLDTLHRASSLAGLDLPGFRTHPLSGTNPLRHSMWVSGAWRITFRWDGEGANEVDLEQYH